VQVTAAWALRKLDVPETLPGVMAYLDEELKRPPAAFDKSSRTRVMPRGDPYTFPGMPRDHQRSQLLQFLGLKKHEASDDLLGKFIPRRDHSSWAESRAAAIWALGMIHEGKNIPALAAALEARLNDVGPNPEDIRVRRMCAVTLGRMGAKETLRSQKTFCPEQKFSDNKVGNACGWAIALLTGEAMQPPETIKRLYVDWFLIPRD